MPFPSAGSTDLISRALAQKLGEALGQTVIVENHPGAGGSLGFADPENGIGFGYVMNQMEAGVLPGERARALVDTLYSCAE